MFTPLEAARILQLLSRRRRLTELDAARALADGARLLATTVSAGTTPLVPAPRAAPLD